MAAATAEAAATMVATATAATTTATAATAEASAAVAATVDAAVATMDEAAATAATATEPLTATFAMASDAASDAAAAVGFESIEDFFSFVNEEDSSPILDTDLVCDPSDTHCTISTLKGYHTALKKAVKMQESQCNSDFFTLSPTLYKLNNDAKLPVHPPSLGQTIVTFQAGPNGTFYGYGSEGATFPKGSRPLLRETQGQERKRTGSLAMMWNSGGLNMGYLNNTQPNGCCGVGSLANCACVIFQAYGLEEFNASGALVDSDYLKCVNSGKPVWMTLEAYNRSAVEQVAGQKFELYRTHRTNKKQGPDAVTAFELMKETFPHVFNDGQKCDRGNQACPCQNLGPWWNNESESGKALLEAAARWFNKTTQGSWTNAFVNNAESKSPFASHSKVVGALFPGGLGNGTLTEQAKEAEKSMNKITPAMFEKLAQPDANGHVALCQSPLAVRAYGWVMLDEVKANTGDGVLPDGTAFDFVVPINPNLEELRGKPSPVLGTEMDVLPMTDTPMMDEP